MKVRLHGKYEATITLVAAKSALPPWFPKDQISVWLQFDEAVDGCLSFGISIEAKDYSEEEFLKVVKSVAELTLTNIFKEHKKGREEAKKQDKDRKALNKLTADLGEKLGIEFRLDLRHGEK